MNRFIKTVAVIAVIAGLQALVSTGSLDAYFVRVLLLSCFSVMLAVSLNIINGYAGQFSLGHAGFFGIGAYTSGVVSVFALTGLNQSLTASLPPAIAQSVILLVCIAAGTAAAALAGLVVGLPSLRLRGDYLAIATLGFGEMIRTALINIDAVGGPRGFSGIPTLSTFFWILLFTVISVWISRNLLNSRHGRALKALRDDEIAASSLGINITRHKVIAFVISAAMAGCAGALYSHYEGFIKPDSFGFLRSIEIVMMVVLGGMGSTTGAILAAVLLTVLPETLRNFSDYRMLIYSALLVFVMLVRPQGLLGSREFSIASLKSRRKETSGGLT